MKNFLLGLFGAIVILSCFLGVFAYLHYAESRYTSDNNFAEISRADYDKKMSDTLLALHNNGIVESSPLWYETKLIAYTVEKDINYDVTFYYSQNDDRSYSLNTICRKEKYMNDLEFHELIRIGLVDNVLAQAKEYELKPGKVVACLLSWEGKDFWGNITCKPTLCDFDCDGQWDYLIDSSASFSSRDEGCITSRALNNYDTVCLSTKGNVISLVNLTGTETFLDFEEMLLEKAPLT